MSRQEFMNAYYVPGLSVLFSVSCYGVFFSILPRQSFKKKALLRIDIQKIAHLMYTSLDIHMHLWYYYYDQGTKYIGYFPKFS